MTKTSYKTKQKVTITNEIKSMGDRHFTVDGICEKLAAKGETAGRTTVYRLLERLSDDGVLRKFAMPQGDSVCYQYIGEHNNCREHFHLKCEKCGSLIHMDCHEMNELAKHIKNHHGFSLNPFKTVIYGVCEACETK